MKVLDQTLVTALAIGAVMLATLPVRAQTWIPTAGGTYDWNSNTNWSAVFPNATDAVANINIDITGDQIINLNQSITVGALTLNDAGSGTDNAITIATGTTGGQLTFQTSSGNAVLTQSNSAATAISSAVVFASNTTITGGNIVFGGPISGAGTVTKSTTGSIGLTLSGDNSAFTGAWVLSGNNTNSRLFISNDNNLGAANVGVTLTNTNGITFGTAANVTLASTRTLTITGALLGFGSSASGTNLNTVNSKITGAGGSVRMLANSSSTVVLGNDTNDFTGSLVLQSGGGFSVNTFADSGVASGAGAGSNVVFGNDSGGGGSLTYTGASAASSNRLLQIVSNSATTTAAVSAQVINNGTAALTLTNTGNFISGVSASTRTLTLGGTNTGSNTFSQLINSDASVGTGLVSLVKQGAGKWVLTSANTFTGATTISGGTLALGADNAIGSGSAITLTSGTFDLQTFSTSAASFSFAAGNTLRFSLSAPDNVTALLALAGNFNKSGSGVFTLDFSGTGQAGTYTLVSFAGMSFTGPSDFTVTNLGSGLSGVLTLDGTSLSLAVSAVPEPSTYAAFAGVFALAAVTLRNRKRRS